MPSHPTRYYGTRHLHFINCSCYHRQPWLARPQRRDLFLRALEQVRQRYGFFVLGYVDRNYAYGEAGAVKINQWGEATMPQRRRVASPWRKFGDRRNCHQFRCVRNKWGHFRLSPISPPVTVPTC
jgi:hypothetical protein